EGRRRPDGGRRPVGRGRAAWDRYDDRARAAAARQRRRRKSDRHLPRHLGCRRRPCGAESGRDRRGRGGHPLGGSRAADVLAARPVTEAELRKLFEEGRACALILNGQIDRDERKLSELATDAASSIAELAGIMRSLNVLRPDLEDLNELLEALNARARESRT